MSLQKFQRCFNVVVSLIWHLDVGQRQIKIETRFLLFSVESYNIELRQINVVYFNVDINNFRQRRNTFVNITICKNLRRPKIYF